jgi:hypothetical protein
MRNFFERRKQSTNTWPVRPHKERNDMTEQKTVRVKLADKMEHHHDGRTYRGGDELDLPEDLAKFLCEPVKVDGKTRHEGDRRATGGGDDRTATWERPASKELTSGPLGTADPTNQFNPRASAKTKEKI